MNVTPDMIKILVSNGYNINYNTNGQTFLYTARHNIDVFRWLLEQGADPNRSILDGQYLLTIDGLSTEIIKLLLIHGANINIQDKEGMTPLFKNINNKPIFELLLEKGGNINFQNKRGNTILHHAIYTNCSDLSTIQLLLDRGVDYTAKNDLNQTPKDMLVTILKISDHILRDPYIHHQQKEILKLLQSYEEISDVKNALED